MAFDYLRLIERRKAKISFQTSQGFPTPLRSGVYSYIESLRWMIAMSLRKLEVPACTRLAHLWEWKVKREFCNTVSMEMRFNATQYPWRWDLVPGQEKKVYPPTFSQWMQTIFFADTALTTVKRYIKESKPTFFQRSRLTYPPAYHPTNQPINQSIKQ